MYCFGPYFITILLSLIPGVPGVLSEKLDEGMKVQHCALSLVGEPIMYPEINKFVRMLHEKGYLFSQMVTFCKSSDLHQTLIFSGISSFLVTNAQFPDAIRDMEPCTQVSSTKHYKLHFEMLQPFYKLNFPALCFNRRLDQRCLKSYRPALAQRLLGTLFGQPQRIGGKRTAHRLQADPGQRLERRRNQELCKPSQHRKSGLH